MATSVATAAGGVVLHPKIRHTWPPKFTWIPPNQFKQQGGRKKKRKLLEKQDHFHYTGLGFTPRINWRRPEAANYAMFGSAEVMQTKYQYNYLKASN